MSEKLNLKYDFASLEWLEEQGLNVMDPEHTARMQTPSGVRLLVQAGLLHVDPDTTKEKAQQEIQRTGITEAATAVSDAFVRDLNLDPGKE